MMDQKFNNLYDAFTSQIEYANYIETQGAIPLDLDKVDFDILIVHFTSFLFTCIIDKYFKVVNNQIHTTLFEEYIREIVNILVKPVDGKYKLGELVYSTPEKVLEKLRNKLAHGDYVIEEHLNEETGEMVKCIVFEENKAKGIIPIPRLVSMVSSFMESYERYDKYQPYTKYLMSISPNKIKKVKDEKDFLSVCYNTYVIEITDMPVVPTQRTISYVNGREDFFDLIKEMLRHNVPIDDVKNFIESKIELFKTRGVNMSVKVSRVSDLDYFEEIQKSVANNKRLYKRLSAYEQINYIIFKSHLHSNGVFQKWNIEQGAFINLVFLLQLKEHPEYSDKDIRAMGGVDKNFVYVHNEDILISPFLVGFNIMYQYGLEKEFSKIGRNNLIDILYGEALDFSCLDLSAFESDVNELEKNFDHYTTDIDEYYDKEKIRILHQMASIENTIKMIESNRRMDKEVQRAKLAAFRENLKALDDELSSLDFEVETLKRRARDFNLERYTLNFNIITHIRNAIAHGNIFISNNKPDINDSEIIIVDYKDNKEVYRKQIKLGDFISLFSRNNVSVIFDFIADNLKDKSRVDDSYVYRIAKMIEDIQSDL